jgi:serine/threonine-protein kinase
VEGIPFGRYQLVELLGRGGMGEVWRAHDTATDRIVAVKLLSPHLADDDTFVHRFRREAQAAARLDSPHVIPIHNYGEIDGRLYVDMRLVKGRDLQAVLAGGRCPPGGRCASSSRSPRHFMPPTGSGWCTVMSNRPTSCSTTMILPT